jgi:ribosome-associated protein
MCQRCPMAGEGGQNPEDAGGRSESVRAEPGGVGGVQIAPGLSVPEHVLRFSYIQSGGPGGQNVNKRATKAELRVNIADLPLPEDARERLAGLAGRRMTEGGELLISSEEHRSQLRNRAACMERLRELVVQARVRPRRRRKTRPTRGSVERRLTEKKQTGERKRRRRSGGDDA